MKYEIELCRNGGGTCTRYADGDLELNEDWVSVSNENGLKLVVPANRVVCIRNLS